MEKNILNHATKLVVIGGSAGSIDVLFKLLPGLLPNLPVAIIIVLHRRNYGDSSLTELLASKTTIPTWEVEDKDQIFPGNIYLAPSDYHLLVEKNLTFSLDYSEKVNFSRPSLDVTFESAADVYGSSVTGIILSGANEDGTNGLRTIKRKGGKIIAQDPETAIVPLMPQFAINHLEVDFVYNVRQIVDCINSL